MKSALAANIKTRRKNIQESLDEKVNTASTYIVMIESGSRTLSFKVIERINASCRPLTNRIPSIGFEDDFSAQKT
jgi:hypothetical protein